jgi:hypothetical protein
MTLVQAKGHLRSIGMTINRTTHGEYRVNYAGGSEATAHYDTDLQSAVDTAIAMAARPKGNPSYSRYGGREGSAEFRPMTLEEAKMLTYGEHIWFLDTKGSARRVKVNGRPQLWKRSPGKIRVPVKYGMYETGQFYEHDFGPGGRVLVPL